MAVPEQTPYIEHIGNGATTSFSLGFQCESKDHLIVLIDDIEPPIATWSLTGGNVVFTTAPAAGKKITLQRNTPFSRTTDYQSYNNSFRPPAVNKDFDWIWLKLQELGVADWILSNRIDALKNYVDDRDDELRAYLMEEIRKQGVALDQLDEYYNYLMQRLAQIAVDKGWDASFVVDGSETQKQINDYRRKAFPSVLDNKKVKGEGDEDDYVGLQEYFRDADDNRKSSIFFPLRNYNYLIDAPLIVQEPLMIYGDAGATYNRGIGKDGKIIIGGTHAFDLGNYRTSSSTQNVDTKKSKNPADNWTLKNLAFTQKTGDSARTKTALLHTAATNGPDRGMILREVSGTGLKHLLRTVDNGIQTQIATVVVENCVASNNELPFKFDGMCYGLRFVGNQCEQNSLGAIKGRVDAHVTIEDNMLEGQRDVIDLEIPVTGNRPKISFKRNYLEANSGEFIFRAKTNTPDSEIHIGGNFYWNHQAKHYVYLQGSAWLATNTDPFPITLGPNTYIKYGSRILNSNVSYYKQDGLSTGFGSIVVTSDFVGMPALSDYTPSNPIPSTEGASETALGNLRYYSGSFSYLSIPLTVNAGDVCAVTVLMSTETGLTESNIQVWDQNISALVNERGGISSGTTMGKLALVTYTFKAAVSATSLRVRIYNASVSGSRKLFGACAKNYGAYTDGALYNIYVSMPPLTRVYPSQNLNYSVTASSTLNLTANTDIVTTVNDARFKVGDSIIVSITQTPNYITRASALVRADGVATVVLTPNTTSSGAVIGLKLKVVVN